MRLAGRPILVLALTVMRIMPSAALAGSPLQRAAEGDCPPLSMTEATSDD